MHNSPMNSRISDIVGQGSQSRADAQPTGVTYCKQTTHVNAL